ncbi:MAG: alpha/beta hydrolase domain-containing protein [Gammaproteobacteria bacterium]
MPGSRMVAAAVLFVMSVSVASADVPPGTRVVGPIPVNDESYPFGAADHTRTPQDLRKMGYVEEEYFFSGLANVYDWPAAGPATVRTPNAPYTTRVLIRRPSRSSRFSGNAVVEMLNPSNRMDLNIGWAISHEQWVRNGDAWIGVTVKPISVVALKTFNPQRYAPLSWENPRPPSDPLNCENVAGDSSRSTENGLVWDAFRQVGLWLRSREASNPFLQKSGRGNSVEHVYAWGYSQTGAFLYTYINAIHPLDVRSYGKPVFDAYLIGVASSPLPINQCSPRIPPGDPRRELRNVGVPVMRIMSQSDFLSGIDARRPDSDDAQDRFRNYEIAGSAHATPDELTFGPAPADIIRAGVPLPPMECNEGPRSRFPNSLAFNAAFRNLDQWVRKGIAPPRAEPIRVENGQPVLDKFGNVIGGVRSPYVDVPTAQWTGTSTGASFCFIAGHEKPFDKTRLKELYPTHAAYVRAIRRNVAERVADRFLVREDGARLLKQAGMN